jgi:hypothetical protein
MVKRLIPKPVFLALFIAIEVLGSLPALAQGKVLDAIFTRSPIKVDGSPESAWSKAPPPMSASA